jgi:hypothetical protein
MDQESIERRKGPSVQKTDAYCSFVSGFNIRATALCPILSPWRLYLGPQSITLTADRALLAKSSFAFSGDWYLPLENQSLIQYVDVYR